MKNKLRYNAAIIGTGRIGFSLGFDKKREQPASHTMTLINNKSINFPNINVDMPYLTSVDKEDIKFAIALYFL